MEGKGAVGLSTKRSDPFKLVSDSKIHEDVRNTGHDDKKHEPTIHDGDSRSGKEVSNPLQEKTAIFLPLFCAIL